VQKQLRILRRTHPHPTCADEAASAFAAHLRLRFASTRSRRSRRRRRKSARDGATAAARRRPGPLPSDGSGRIVRCRSVYPIALEGARDAARCSLSRRTGEGQGEGLFVRNTPPVRHLFLHEPLVPRSKNTTTFVVSIFGSGEAPRGSIPRSGAVTEEQRSQNRKATQPYGRRSFLAQISLLAPYRPLKGMLVARASSGPKIPRRKRGRIYGTGYLARSRYDA
jgi:hypothetical protein